MNDISLIHHQIKFHNGCRVDIWDHHSETYLLEFYEKDRDDWALVKGFHTISKFTFYHFGVKKFSTQWQIRISGWEKNKIKPLAVHTYSHYNKDILLIFDSDRFEDHVIWAEISAQMVEKYKCSITIVSKFKDRILKDPRISILDHIPEDYFDRFYSSFGIGKNNTVSQFDEIPSVTYFPKSLDLPLNNGTNPYYSSYHRNNFIRMTAEELFKDIINI